MTAYVYDTQNDCSLGQDHMISTVAVYVRVLRQYYQMPNDVIK